MDSVPQTPDRQTRNAVTARITAHVTAGWPRLGEPRVRYRGQYCYVAALLPGHREPAPILRLRWQGSPTSGPSGYTRPAPASTPKPNSPAHSAP
jgi:hypothetical protein